MPLHSVKNILAAYRSAEVRNADRYSFTTVGSSGKRTSPMSHSNNDNARVIPS